MGIAPKNPKSPAWSVPKSGAAPVHGRAKRPETIEERLKAIFASVLGSDDDELYLVTRLSSDLEADSLDYWELMIRVEDEFGIAFSDQCDVTAMDFFGDWLTLVTKKGGGRGPERAAVACARQM